MKMLVRILAPLAVGLGITCLAGCSSSQGSPTSNGPTEAEYRHAVQASADCLAAEGFQVSEVTLQPDGYTYGYTVTSRTGADTGAAMNECDEESGLTDIGPAYIQTLRLTGAERERAMEEMVACLEEVGVTGLSATETDSRVFVRAVVEQIPDSDPDSAAAWLCLDRGRIAWPPGDANFP